MSEKKQNSNKKKKSRLTLNLRIVLFLGVFVIAAMLLIHHKKSETAAQHPVVQDEPVQIQQSEKIGVKLGNGLEILDVGGYTGAYVEDGTDEIVSGILMLKVINNGTSTVEYASITMEVNGKTAEFAVSTLKPGATVVLLEKNRMVYDKNANYLDGELACENLSVFREPLNLYEDKIAVQVLDGAINVTNISQEDIPGRISIYYKNAAAGVYYGGITYRVTLENGLKAGEIRQMTAKHFSDTGSEIMFLTIAE